MSPTQANFYLDNSYLQGIKSTAKTDKNEAMKQVAEQFESLFLKEMISTMRKASFGGGMGDEGQGMEHYQGMYDNQLAVVLAKRGGIGLADRLTRQLGSSMRLQSDKNNSDQLKAQSILPLNLKVPQRDLSVNAVTAQALPLPKVNKAEIQQEAQLFPMQGVDARRQFNRNIVEIKIIDNAFSNVVTPKQNPTITNFVKSIISKADKAAKQLGVDPKVLISQSALETGWGKHIPKHIDGSSSFNLFGIKANNGWQGKTVTIETKEFEHGRFVTREATFRAYNSEEASLNDYVKFIQNNPRYQQALTVSGDSAQYLQELQKAGYATDPKYAHKIQNIMQRLSTNIKIALNRRGTKT
jgi:flagellar protein FlgJ